ncbi:DUF4263 domain-containing protein [Methylobacterium sp. WL18]|uniref:Shedu immune nuclease family protein n=1 Tax=Methylobacterium sp. WL18 TaxID=2603897 RepID=UPI0011CB32CB|nr:Shedu immune nuclease family protein [Methylobacterium sp. WL18]TXN75529.1 DUF4263 domain-containing protein [Methylobacterium sp. WL18]
MDDDDYGFHMGKLPDKFYVTKRFAGGLRIASKVLDIPHCLEYAKELGEVVLRVTHKGRQEIRATFNEYARDTHGLTIQKWNTTNGFPSEKVSFNFGPNELNKLLEFVAHIKKVHFPSELKLNVDDKNLAVVALTNAEARQFAVNNQALFAQIAQNEITEQDVVALGFRRKQLAHFERLLEEPGFFESERERQNIKPEDVWQRFFEFNPWIFGHGLSYIFASSLNDRKLEQIVRGHSLVASGKRVDGLLKTNALIQSLCYVEIKRHDTKLLKPSSYRPGVWQSSDELAGGVAQIQETVRAAAENIRSRYKVEDEEGYPTGEELSNVHPRSYLVAGCLGEFRNERGTNFQKYQAFESFRRNLVSPEIITFDELFYRAKNIVVADDEELPF